MAQLKTFLVITLLLIFTLAAESRTIRIGAAASVKGADAASLACNSVHGAEDGETCFSVAQQFNLQTEEFLEINPNINCDSIFVGQWLCVDGSVSP